ncbi:MAG: hypothetical protein J0G33_02375 [Afipia felis]|nr:hypothetical protein [Afipia felis]
MHLHFKGGFDEVDLQLLAIVAIMIALGCGIYLFGDMYEAGEQAGRVARALPSF